LFDPTHGNLDTLGAAARDPQRVEMELNMTRTHTAHKMSACIKNRWARETEDAMSEGIADPRTVRVELGERSYDIRIQPGLIPLAGGILRGLLRGNRLLIVTDRNIGHQHRHGHALASSLQKAGFDGSAIELPPGEGAKSLDVAKTLYDLCIEAKLDRSSTLLALGGGVIGDLTGFIAATFMRGIDVVQVPTTLLAMVDASVGGKVAIDHPKSKNAIGAFHQPRAVLIDPLALNTLPDRELKSGLAEVIKYGVIEDAGFFTFCEQNIEKMLARDPVALGHAIEVSCRIKARVVGNDEREREGGPRALLNYGHTFGHAIEACKNYQGYLHGEAVAIGMVLAGELAVERGRLKREEAERIAALLMKAGLPTQLTKDDPKAADLHASTYLDKKARGGKPRFVLATTIGSAATFDDVPEDAARKVWDSAPRL
jgi:3-dehydroquinate synthase